MTTLICDCNQTMPLNAQALGTALREDLTLHSTLCRREAGAFQKAIQSGDDVLVACTQEKRLFSELAEQTESAVSVIRFVNIRETGGWSRDAAKATPKIAALLAAAPFQQWVDAIDIAGPGFINIRLKPAAKQQIVREVLATGACFGQQPANGRKLMVEFVSANPTGPLHVGHGRQAALGDAPHAPLTKHLHHQAFVGHERCDGLTVTARRGRHLRRAAGEGVEHL